MKRYSNFDLELFAAERGDAGERFRLRVARSPAGEMALAEAKPTKLPRELRAKVLALSEDRLELPELIELGETLGALLLPEGRARELFQAARAGLEVEEGLRLRLKIEEPALASLPWELAYLALPGTRAAEKDARGFLSLDPRLSLTRHEVLAAPAGSFAPVPRPRLLCLFSGASLPGLAPLDLARERQGIRAAVEASGIELRDLESATLADLQRGLDGGAELFHYAGHGHFEEQFGEIPKTREGKGYLLLETPEGKPLLVPAEQVGLNLAGAGVRLAVLNGCETARRDVAHSWTGIAPLLVQSGIPAVLANQFQIGDEAAIELARRFYEKLATGEPVDAAVSAARLACSNLERASRRDFATPVLYLRLAEESDGVLLPPAAAGQGEAADPKPNRWFWLNLALLAALLAGVLPWAAHRALGFDLLATAGAGLAALVAAWGIVDRLAGEHLNTVLRAWLRRKAAAAWLGGLLALSGAAGTLAPPPAPVVLLLPFNGVVSRLPSGASSTCTLRLSAAGRTLLEVESLKREAILVAASDEAAAAALAGDALVTELLLERPAGEQQPQREQFFRRLLSRHRVAPARLPAGTLLHLEIVERLPDGSERPLYAAERRLEELEGERAKTWFLEGGPP